MMSIGHLQILQILQGQIKTVLSGPIFEQSGVRSQEESGARDS